MFVALVVWIGKRASKVDYSVRKPIYQAPPPYMNKPYQQSITQPAPQQNSADHKFCGKCGIGNPKYGKFCKKCGNPFEQN